MRPELPGAMTDPFDDALTGRVLAELLDRSHLMGPADLARQLTEAARPLGFSAVRIYLADLQQQRLSAMPDGNGPERSPLAIDSTLAGRAFQTISIQRAAVEESTGEHRLWVPLVNGTERLGVMEMCVAERPPGDADGVDLLDVGLDEKVMLERCRTLASLAALIIESKNVYSDSYAAIQRSREMTVQAEMVWAFMVPRTFATGRVLLAAALEPAYEVGGDAFEYSLLGDCMHVSVFDSVGHDLTAGLISSVAMASCRTARRAGGDLPEMAARADHAIADQFGASRFATALLCELDTATGEFRWLPCGHPPPLLIRDSRVIKELLREPRLPLGLNEDHVGDVGVYTEHLQPGDRLLLYTDGVVEGRAADGREFGLARLSDFVIRNSAEGLPAPETLRRLNRAILQYQQGRVRDDATVVLVEWLPQHPEHDLTI
ncbi:MAG: serine/threonine-protein phosphatase [Actinoallomurus sp.]|nr:serine/threonine-protein phosphatase [Actinoallomurus sp.]